MNSLKTALEELKAERTRIDTAIMAMQALIKETPMTRHKHRLTIIEAVIAHLRKTRKPQTSKQLRGAISAAGIMATPQSIQTLLSRRMRTKKDLVKKGWGVWALK